MFQCLVAAFAPCMLLCSGTADQFAGIDARYFSERADGRIQIVIQPREPQKSDGTTIDFCTADLLAPPEPWGGVIMAGDKVLPGTDTLVAQYTTRPTQSVWRPRFKPTPPPD